MLKATLLIVIVAASIWSWINSGPKPLDLSDALPEYDFIVVGSGSAGGIVATRLSEDPQVNVLLLEAGDMDPWNAQVPALPVTMLGGEYDWKYKTQPCKSGADGYKNKQVGVPRGKVLGGTSQLNWMYYHRGHKGDYDQWASEGNAGWSFADVRKYFDKLEDMTVKELKQAGKSTGGPVGISYGLRSKFGKLFLQGLRETGQVVMFDSNQPEMEGFARQQLNTKDGRRQSTAECYIRPNMDRANFHVVTKAMVTRVLINEAKQAIGVTVKSGGKSVDIKARKEVIVSAGAYNTPQLLMWSGIGPKTELDKAKVKPVLINDNVGKNLEDHVMSITSLLPSQPIGVAHPSFDGDLLFAIKGLISRALFGGESDMGKGCFEVTGMLRSGKKPSLKLPDIQLYFTPSLVYNRDYLIAQNFDDETVKHLSKMHAQYHNFLTIAVGNLHPDTRGSVTLDKNDPYGDPIIDYDVISNDVDRDVIVEGLKKAHIAFSVPPLAKYNITPMFPLTPHCAGMQLTSVEYFQCLVKHLTLTIYHPTSTCRMGKDKSNSVVGNKLRVHGIKGLRIVDASVMPHVPSGNTNAPVMMIGEKAADMIKEEHRLA